MLELLGKRQNDLLKHLMRQKDGLTVDELGTRLEVTRTAVRQHLAALERDGFVAEGASKATGGRPTRLYVLTQKGRELFPRQYSWLAQLMIESMAQEGGAGLRKRLQAMGAQVGGQLRAQHAHLRTRQDRVLKLSELLEQLGYNTAGTTVLEPSVIKASNCVFHDLAQKDQTVCQFDLALMAAFTDSSVDLKECMAHGGHVCKFKFGAKAA